MKRLRALTHPQTRLLRAILDHSGATHTTLAKAAGVSQPVVTRQLKSWRDAGVVRASLGADDLYYSLTARGQRLRTVHEEFYARLAEVA